MGQLAPVTLDDGTVLYIEATDRTEPAPGSPPAPVRPPIEDNPKRGFSLDQPQKQITQSFQAIETTIRAYTTYTLNAFKNLAIAEVSEVTLKFGVNVDIQTGLPYIANGKAGCSTEITVKCILNKP